MTEPAAIIRPVGRTEHSSCRAVPGGTGMTVLAHSFSASPDLSLEKALCQIQASHPILRSRIRFDPTTNSFSFVTPPSLYVVISDLVQECKSQGVKLCAALAAAAHITAHSSKQLSDQQWQKYAVVTLVDCRQILEPPLCKPYPGFYHSAILNTHDFHGGEKLWELARRTYGAFSNAKDRNKHFSDMGDLNFLMCRALDNPGLTPSSSLRTALISVFEDPVIEESRPSHGDIGLLDNIGCASVQGIGPSITIFDTIRDGKINCLCVYPYPLHSREQMRELIDRMKTILAGEGGEDVESAPQIEN